MNLYSVALTARKAARSSADLHWFMASTYAGRKVTGTLANGREVTGTIVTVSNMGMQGIQVTIETSAGQRLAPAEKLTLA